MRCSQKIGDKKEVEGIEKEERKANEKNLEKKKTRTKGGGGRRREEYTKRRKGGRAKGQRTIRCRRNSQNLHH